MKTVATHWRPPGRVVVQDVAKYLLTRCAVSKFFLCPSPSLSTSVFLRSAANKHINEKRRESEIQSCIQVLTVSWRQASGQRTNVKSPGKPACFVLSVRSTSPRGEDLDARSIWRRLARRIHDFGVSCSARHIRYTVEVIVTNVRPSFQQRTWWR